MSFSAAGRVERVVEVGDDKALLFMADGTVRFRHVCDRSARDAGTIVCSPALSDLHTVRSDDPVDVSPSILCSDCGTHGYVRDGAWEAC